MPHSSSFLGKKQRRSSLKQDFPESLRRTGFEQTEVFQIGALLFWGTEQGFCRFEAGRFFPKKCDSLRDVLKSVCSQTNFVWKKEYDSAGLNRQAFDESYHFVGLKTKTLSR